ncbi:hypothetical protein [Maritimibacter sp. 55A14]|uniref:hypothetical protein n=1 Tax=Maritimibacter sp. 55A14 TaxID=2174844 RepID=UPI0011B2195D|nr:hypothetical protein [Maritimibacter sp. 55A14]
MDRLNFVLILVTGPVLVGGLVTIVLSLGLDTVIWLIGAIVVGLALTYPAALLTSRYIKRRDPYWHHTEIKRIKDLVPDPEKPES